MLQPAHRIMTVAIDAGDGKATMVMLLIMSSYLKAARQ